MTIVVGSGVQPHTAASARRAKKRRSAAAAHAAPKPAPKLNAVLATAASPVAAASAGAVAIAAPAPSPAPPAPKQDEPAAPVPSPEYEGVDLAEVLGGVAGGVTGEFVGPIGKASVTAGFDVENNPWFATQMGGVIPAKLGSLMVGEVAGVVSGALTNALQGALHGKVPGVGEKQPGLGISITPANVLATRLTKGVVTTWANMFLKGQLSPPPPPPPAPAPDQAAGKEAPGKGAPGAGKEAPKLAADAPAGDTGSKKPAPVPNPQREAFKQPLAPLAQAAANSIVGTAIGAVYDQTLGPVVQKLLNPGAPTKAPAPLTPGKIAKGFVGDMLTPLLVPSISLPDGTPPSVGGSLGASIVNNVLGAAFDTFYSRGLGPAVETAVNGAVGIRDPEAVKKDPLPAAERFLRTATRGVAVGATTFALGTALQSTLFRIGTSMGGVGGALVAMAGAALIGAIGGQVVDATVGPLLGKIGGQLYSLLSGKPSYEQRIKDAAAQAPSPANPGPTPGSPVNAPNGNTGVVPAPPAANAAPKPKAKAAPAAGKPKKRAKLGMPRVDATAPAIHVPLKQLTKAALSG